MWAADHIQAALDPGQGLKAGYTEGVLAVEHPRNSVSPGIVLEAHSALLVFIHNHGWSRREDVTLRCSQNGETVVPGRLSGNGCWRSGPRL